MQPTDPYQLPSSNPPSAEQLRVGVGPRLGALIIDLMIMIAVSVVVTIFFMNVGITPNSYVQAEVDQLHESLKFLAMFKIESGPIEDFMGPLIVASIIVNFAYSLIELMWGTSPGKLTLGLQIANADGRRGNVQLFARRWAVKHVRDILQFAAFISGVIILQSIGGFLGLIITIGYFLAFSDARMALHDRVSQTAVFRSNDIKG